MSRIEKIGGFAGMVASLMLLVTVPPVGAQSSEDASDSAERVEAAAMRIARGRTTFRIYCQNCHGKTALGDGPIAELLNVAPADLTRIRQRNDGTYPFEEIYGVIDGRQNVRGHGRREMPVWGLSFQDPNRDSDQEGDVRERIVDLVLFLESIQVDAEENAG